MSIRKTLARSFSAALAVGLCFAHLSPAAAVDGLDFKPMPDGGSRWTASAPALSYDANANSKVGVTRTSTLITYAKSKTDRSGCLLNAPWIPVAGKSDVLVFPGITVNLRSPPLNTPAKAPQFITHMDEWDWPYDDLVEIWVEIKPTDKPAITRKFVIDLDDLTFRKKLVRTADDLVYFEERGVFWTSIAEAQPMVFNVGAPEAGKARVRVCNISPDTAVKVENMAIDVLPVD